MVSSDGGSIVVNGDAVLRQMSVVPVMVVPCSPHDSRGTKERPGAVFTDVDDHITGLRRDDTFANDGGTENALKCLVLGLLGRLDYDGQRAVIRIIKQSTNEGTAGRGSPWVSKPGRIL